MTGSPAATLMVSGITGGGFPFTPLQMLWQPPGPTLQGRECSAVRGLGGFGQRIKRGVEAVLAAPVGFVVGFGGYEPDQLLEVVCTDQQDSAVGVCAHAKHSRSQSGSSTTSSRNTAAVSSLTMTSSTSPATLNRRRRTYKVSAQLLITPRRHRLCTTIGFSD